ncbi:TPA: hypothetical protein EYP26_00155 [Candidatus Bathyarchaeota archaeon]|nr:hypothetical protein [Candidatus Bathyarchaeota archaeon]
MAGKKIKIEFFDNDGVKHTIALEGEVSREKIAQILDYIELMGGAHSGGPPAPPTPTDNKFEKLRKLLLYHFSDKIFVSKEVQKAYAEFYGEPISLSTVSTYLSRLADRNFLSRAGSPGEWRYALSRVGPARVSRSVNEF